MNKPKYTTESFVKACKDNPLLQNNDGTPKYDYSETIYNPKEITIICHVKDENGIEHGKFTKRPSAHLNQGQGCRKCQYQNRKISQEQFIKKCKENYPEYDYSKTIFYGMNYNINYICPKHGLQTQRADVIYYKHGGCNKCGNEKMSNKLLYSNEEFIKKAKNIHDKLRVKQGLPLYDYSETKYINIYDKIKINCPLHGNFKTIAEYHLHNNSGCPYCSNNNSNIEKEIYKFIKDNFKNIEILHNIRKIISPNELDIYIPSKNIAIELNGLYWHSEIYKENNYHLEKTEACEKQGIQLIHIFEDEWIEKQDIVKSRLLNILGKSKWKIGARKCVIKQVNSEEERNFLETNHLQGYIASSLCYGLYYYNKDNNKEYLVSLMSFGNLRKNLGSKQQDNVYEMYRFCNAKYFNIQGSASRLFKYFIKIIKPKQVISYADRRYSINSLNNLYRKLGFIFDSYSKPGYFYIEKSIIKRFNRYNYRKDILISKYNCSSKMSEHEFMNQIMNMYQIYDCGQIKYVWNN